MNAIRMKADSSKRDEIHLVNSGAPVKAVREEAHTHAHFRNILVVDDDPDTLEFVSRVINAISPETNCVCTNNSYEALNYLAENNFDFILTDYLIPEISGTSIIYKMDRQINSDPLFADSDRFMKKVPVVVMSGRSIPSQPHKKLVNFELKTTVRKSDLTQFLTKNFSH